MASVYTNDLRLEEIGSGEQSGTWGDTTNTNLELIAEAFSFGTEAITTNADTHATTIADGATDAGRSMFLKYTGTLDSACTITIGPNTVSKLWFIENGTSGSQNIIIKQGSGATITIPPGDTKAIYSNGAGGGGAMFDAFASLSVVDLKVQDDLTVTDDLVVGGLATIGETLVVTGVLTTTAATVSNGGGQFNGTVTVGVDDTGYDVKFFGDAASAFMLWDASTDDLILGGASNFGAGTATPQTRIHSTSSQEQLTLSEGNGKGATFDYRSSTGNLNIATNGTNARSAPQLTLATNGDVNVQDGNLVVGTAGHGIDFSAQVASSATGVSSSKGELLDHYEQGAFTPILQNSGGTQINAYTAQAGFYVRVGARVHAHGYIVANGIGGAGTGQQIQLGGFPFDAVNVTNGHAAMAITYGSNMNITAGQNCGGFLGPNTTLARVHLWDLAVGTSAMLFSELSDNGEFMFTVSYNAV